MNINGKESKGHKEAVTKNEIIFYVAEYEIGTRDNVMCVQILKIHQ